MAESKDSPVTKGVTGIINQILSFIPQDIREMIGVWVGIWIFMLAPLAILGGVKLIVDATKTPREPDKPCWQLQQVGDKVFKLNTCTGEAVELKVDAKAPLSPPGTK